jgi:hypothetical protein
MVTSLQSVPMLNSFKDTLYHPLVQFSMCVFIFTPSTNGDTVKGQRDVQFTRKSTFISGINKTKL